MGEKTMGKKQRFRESVPGRSTNLEATYICETCGEEIVVEDDSCVMGGVRYLLAV